MKLSMPTGLHLRWMASMPSGTASVVITLSIRADQCPIVDALSTHIVHD